MDMVDPCGIPVRSVDRFSNLAAPELERNNLPSFTGSRDSELTIYSARVTCQLRS